MADSDDEDELLVTFGVTSVAAAAATFMLDAAATTWQSTKMKTQSVGEQVFAKTGIVRDIQ